MSPSRLADQVAGEDILFVCTANICRSPMAAELLKSKLRMVPNVRVRSAGFGQDGIRPARDLVEFMQGRGVDLRGHLSTRVESVLTNPPDLLLGMARQHLRSLFQMHPGLLSRTFTLKEFVRLAETEGQRLPGEEIGKYLSRVGAGRSVSALFFGADDDIADPTGRRKSAYKRCASEIEDLVGRLAQLLYAKALQNPGMLSGQMSAEDYVVTG
jgi:protein-tyrosine phosphatase